MRFAALKRGADTLVCRQTKTSALLLLIALLFGGVLPGCHETASTPTKHLQQRKFQQADHGEALLKAAASQLNDLPAAVDTELRPPVVILDSRKSTDGKDVLATCSADPHASNDSFNVIRVPTGNSRFHSLGVRAGDVLKYYVKEDTTVDVDSRNAGYSRQLAMDLNVAQVLNDNTLLLENGLNQEVPNPGRKIEIWRFVDDRLAEIHEKLSLYEIYRKPPVGWEPAPDEPVLTQVIAWLNQWIRQSDPKTDWHRDALLDTLDTNLRGDTQLANFISPDALAQAHFRPTTAGFYKKLSGSATFLIGLTATASTIFREQAHCSIGPCEISNWKPASTPPHTDLGKRCSTVGGRPSSGRGCLPSLAGNKDLIL